MTSNSSRCRQKTNRDGAARQSLHDSRESKSRQLLAAWWGPMLIVAAAAVMLCWTWGTWPDVLVDYGHERYLPCRLMEGEVLYRDIACYNGPLSQYFNAICFTYFGPSLRTMVFCNLAILAVLAGLLYYVLRQVGHRLAAVTAMTVFVLLFAFGQYVTTGNYNYVCPYAHEITHGVTLSLAAMVAAWQAGRFGWPAAFASGLCLGLAFLTKAEVFLPGAAGVGVAILLWLWLERPGWRHGLTMSGCLAAAVAVPPLAAFACLSCAMPAGQALAGTAGSWMMIFDRRVRELPFFSEGMGTDHPLENLRAMTVCTGVYLVVLVPAGLLGWALRRPGRYRDAVAAVVFAAVAGAAWCLRGQIDWYDFGRPLPLMVLTAGAAIVAGFVARRGECPSPQRFVRQISLLVFAMTALGKMILNSRIDQYGFVLAMPAVLVMVVAVFDWAPGFIKRRGGSGRVFRAAAAAMLLAIVAAFLNIQAEFLAAKTYRVGTGADAFWADVRGEMTNQAVAWIVANSPAEATLAALPEGAILNCLAQRRDPTPYINVLPTEVVHFGEDQVLAAFRNHPPDMIALVHKDTTEFGSRFFGSDYCRELGEWIRGNYQPVDLIGAPPLRDQWFGILLLKRRDASATSKE